MLFRSGLIGIVGDISAFIRGDSNGDEKVDISDPIATLGYLFLGATRLRCLDAADANDDGKVDVSDPVATLSYLFEENSRALPPPTEAPGYDPTEDGLACHGAP